VVLERAREGLGRDLTSLEGEARLLGEAREEVVRLEEERAARLAEVAAVEADLALLGVVVGQGQAALHATEHRAVTRYLVFCRERARVEELRLCLGLEGVAPLGDGEGALQDLAARLGVDLVREQARPARLCSFCEAEVAGGQVACRPCRARCKALEAT